MIRKRGNFIYMMVALVLFFGTGITQEVSVSADPGVAEVVIKENLPACLAESVAVEDIRRQRDEIETARKALLEKESELKAREVAIQEELMRLERAHEEIAKSEGVSRRENEEIVAKIVEMLEGMSPKAASQLLSDVDETLAVAAMARISTARLAKIMNVMESGRSKRLTEVLAGIFKSRSTPATAGAKGVVPVGTLSRNPSAKGGESNDGHNDNKKQLRSGGDQPEPARSKPDEQGSS